jgi:hypothetical protein
MVDAAELTDPVAYANWWAVVAAVLPLIVVAWYVGVSRWTRGRAPRTAPERRHLATVRREHLARLDRVEAAVTAGALSARAAHQSISEIVRAFVTDVGPVDARTMTLEQLRESTSAEVVDLVELLYPPEFAPAQQGRPDERLTPALQDARRLVATWVP